jgi:hypothetical protein
MNGANLPGIAKGFNNAALLACATFLLITYVLFIATNK